MDVKVTLKTKKIFVLPSDYKETPDEFPNIFVGIGLDFFEPTCPFCGQHLENANCYCENYRAALKAYLSKFQRDNMFVKVYDVPATYSFDISKLKVSYKKIDTPQNSLTMFDGGTKACHPLTKTAWFVSLGMFENGILNFFMRKEGSEDVYLCAISGIELPEVAYSTVAVCYMTEITSHHRFNDPVDMYYIVSANLLTSYTEVTKVSYQKFLTELKKI